MNFKTFVREFVKQVNPHDVVDSDIDSGQAYTLICSSKLKQHHPKLHKHYVELHDTNPDEMYNFEHEYLWSYQDGSINADDILLRV